jgi:hypothetical protein
MFSERYKLLYIASVKLATWPATGRLSSSLKGVLRPGTWDIEKLLLAARRDPSSFELVTLLYLLLISDLSKMIVLLFHKI